MYKYFFFFFLLIFFATDHVFSQQDSLLDSWNERLDAINFSNIDMLPVYRFTLQEVQDEAKQFENKENRQLDDLHKRINHISCILEQKLLQMDALFFAKALQFEQQDNEKEAVFYYKRSLDFNPSYCLSIEKLSHIYAKNNQNKQHIELLHFLNLDNRLKNCSLQPFDFAFKALITQANHLIGHHNYYDALKVLDTMKIFLHYLPQEKHLSTYDILSELAQNGIYTSYYDIINRSIKVNNLSLAKEYISGLRFVIESKNQSPNHNFFFGGAVQNLIFAHRENVNMNIERKQYSKAIETTDSMVAFLNNLNYLYTDNLFFDIYSVAYTGQYSLMMKNEDPLANEFYQKYSSYIIEKFEIQSFETKNIKQNSIDEDSLAEIKLLMLEYLSKTNQYAWSNELLKAMDLLENIDSLFARFALQDDSVLTIKKAETAHLVEERIEKYASEEIKSRFVKANDFLEQGQYYSAYRLLVAQNPIIGKSHYKLELDSFAKQIELPALFQKKEQEAMELLEIGYFEDGFAKYKQAYAYFQEHEIGQWDLEYDNLQDFIEKSNQEEYYRQLIFYYIKTDSCKSALIYLFQTVNKNRGNKQWLEDVGNEMKKAKGCDELIKKYCFTKEYKPFLNAYFGKKRSWWYIAKSYFKKKNKLP